MRYRLTIITVIATAVAAAALVIALNRSDGESPELSQPDLFPDGLGLVAAFTATAEAGGAALDPTALATPTSTSTAPDRQPTVGSSVGPGSNESPVVQVSSENAKAGEQLSAEVSGAVPGESFEVTVNGTPVEASVASTDSAGNATFEITLPQGVSGDSVELTVVGSESGETTVQISVSAGEPSIAVRPEDPEPGESITVNAEGFKPGEAVTISVAGEEIGSGIAGQDGSFSMTTGLPDGGQESGSQPISVEGDAGSVASTELTQPGSAGPAGSGGPSSGAPTGGSEQSTGGSATPQDEPAATGTVIPTWVYVVVGAMAGWLAVLTLWVYRLDRDREAQFKFMQGVITELVASRQSALDSEVGDSPSGIDRDERAA